MTLPPTTPARSYRREVTTTARPYIGSMVFTALVVGTLLGTILYTAFSVGDDSDLKTGITNMSVIAIVPTIIGVRLAHHNFILDHKNSISALQLLGVSNRFFRQQFLLQGLALVFVATAAAVILGRLLVHPFLSLILAGLNKNLPHTWGSPIAVLPLAFAILAVIYLIALWPLRTDRIFEKSERPTNKASRLSGKKWGGAAGILAAVAIGTGLWILFFGSNTKALVILIFTSPFLAIAIAKPMGTFLSRALSAALRRLNGWTAPAVGIRSSVAAETFKRVGLIAIVVAIPLVAFTWVEVSLGAARYYASQQIGDTSVVVASNKRLFTPEEAESVCEDVGEQCKGIIAWQPSDVQFSQKDSVPRADATDYSISSTSPEALEAFLTSRTPVKSDNAFHLEYMQLFAAVSDSAPVDPDWALVVTTPTADISAPYRVMDTQDWVRDKAWNDQIFYGPYGDGTAGFIPLTAYMLLATCVILVVSTLGKLAGLREFFAPLSLLGRSSTSIKGTVMWTLLFPYFAGTLAAIGSALWYSTVGYVTTTGRLGTFLPWMAPGLWILFATVFIGTGATAFLPANTERARNTHTDS